LARRWIDIDFVTRVRLHLPLLALLLLMACSAPASGATSAASRATGLALGVTHTHYSLDPWEPAASRARGMSELSTHPGTIQVQALMGWGTVNPEPSPGHYDWSTLDRRMALIRQTGGTPVITLCSAPDWMKGGPVGSTNWNTLDVAPTPAHYADFAALARQVALRYPDVHTFLVWNELKGFWDATNNRWDIEDYTKLFNQVAAAVHSVNPTAQVGGPYINAVSWTPAAAPEKSVVSGSWGMLDGRVVDAVKYWLANEQGAGLIAVDGSAERRDNPVAGTNLESKFADVTRWLRSITSLPVWWSELYPVRFEDPPTASSAAKWTDALQQLDGAGATAAVLWQPQGKANGWTGLWTDPTVSSGGQATSWYSSINDYLHPADG
jgi:hypothetical protein